MPVVTPSAASTETVKSVEYISRFSATMRFRPNCSARSFEMGTQIKPRPCIAMKFTDAAVAFSAAITRSPSFSRSASSVTITIFPEATSATTSSTASNSNVSGVVTCEITRANNYAGGRLRQLLAVRSIREACSPDPPRKSAFRLWLDRIWPYQFAFGTSW